MTIAERFYATIDLEAMSATIHIDGKVVETIIIANGSTSTISTPS